MDKMIRMQHSPLFIPIDYTNKTKRNKKPRYRTLEQRRLALRYRYIEKLIKNVKHRNHINFLNRKQLMLSMIIYKMESLGYILNR